jgi:hypothetical protein
MALTTTRFLPNCCCSSFTASCTCCSAGTTHQHKHMPLPWQHAPLLGWSLDCKAALSKALCWPHTLYLKAPQRPNPPYKPVCCWAGTYRLRSSHVDGYFLPFLLQMTTLSPASKKSSARARPTPVKGTHNPILGRVEGGGGGVTDA